MSNLCSLLKEYDGICAPCVRRNTTGTGLGRCRRGLELTKCNRVLGGAMEHEVKGPEGPITLRTSTDGVARFPSEREGSWK